ncbi:MAG: hypothetical protein M1824_001192 [Vezdaea acicularis]|nr:MAG: hypothetical protein M1824_001192 [Vezdaea acicularis]
MSYDSEKSRMWDAKNDYERDWRRRVLEARGNPRANDPDYLPPAQGAPDFDENDLLHHPPRDPNCQHLENLANHVNWRRCGVHVFSWSKLTHWTCGNNFRDSTTYVCKNAMCRFSWEESTNRTDCGKHGSGPHQYGIDGQGKWDS